MELIAVSLSWVKPPWMGPLTKMPSTLTFRGDPYKNDATYCSFFQTANSPTR